MQNRVILTRLMESWSDEKPPSADPIGLVICTVQLGDHTMRWNAAASVIPIIWQTERILDLTLL